MKTSTKITVAAMAGMAAAQSIPACAINCFQDVITEHPPLECKEADMYHCFCKEPFGPDLQQWYLQCCESDCGSTEEANNAIQFGIDLCSEIGFPITVELPTSPATTSAAAVTTTEAAVVTTTPAAQSTSAAQESSASPAESSTPTETSAAAASTTVPAPGVTSTAVSEPAVETIVASGSVSESASASASTSGAVSASGSATASVSGSATASVSGPAGVSSSAVASASHGHGAHGSNTTVIDEVSVTTTVCPESEQATAVVTVTSAVQVCPGGCNGSPSGSSITVITKPSSPSDNAHASPSQGGAAPSGSGAVVPTKSTGGSGSGSSSAAASASAEPSTVVVNAGNTGSVSGLMAAAGVAAAVFRLL